jgi:hypothetical protein
VCILHAKPPLSATCFCSVPVGLGLLVHWRAPFFVAKHCAAFADVTVRAVVKYGSVSVWCPHPCALKDERARSRRPRSKRQAGSAHVSMQLDKVPTVTS